MNKKILFSGVMRYLNMECYDAHIMNQEKFYEERIILIKAKIAAQECFEMQEWII